MLKKLNYKGQHPILIINPPDQFQPVINGLTAEIHTQIRRKYDFILFFVRSLADAYNQVEAIVNALEEDGHLWLCYPKKTSKKYEANINRTVNLRHLLVVEIFFTITFCKLTLAILKR